MSKMFSTLLFLTVLAASRCLFGQATGEIMAKVLSPNMNPIADAVVWAMPADGRPMAAAIPECLTLADGACTIKGISPGTYRVTAIKESDGYPNTAYEFYAYNRKPLLAKIKPNGTPAGVTISLGPKAASLFLDVVDSVTRGDISKKPTVTLRLAREPRIFIRSIAYGAILLPPDEDVLAEVSIEGFEPWKSATALRARSGENIHLTVELRPK